MKFRIDIESVNGYPVYRVYVKKWFIWWKLDKTYNFSNVNFIVHEYFREH